MQVFSIAKGFNKVSTHAPCELSVKELDRLRALRLWQETKDTRLICETFGMSRATLYRWWKRFDPHDLTSLGEGSRRPRGVKAARLVLRAGDGGQAFAGAVSTVGEG